MLICRIKGSRCALSQGKYRNESKSRRMTEARGLAGSLYSASTIVYARTQTYTPPCEQLWKLSRCAECLRAVRKLSASSESVLGDGGGNGRIEGWNADFARLSSLESTSTSPALTPSSPPALTQTTLTTTVHLFPSSIFGIQRFSSSRHSCLRASYRGPATRLLCARPSDLLSA